MTPIHHVDRLERAYGLPKSAEVKPHATLFLFDFCSDQDLETRRYICRRLREAARLRQGPVSQLRSGG
jgi:hypothetical protein